MRYVVALQCYTYIHMKNIFKLTCAIALCELTGIIGSVFTMSAIPAWYATLTKPALNPPAWVFGPVWTTLFALMGIALYLVWKKGTGRADVRKALYIFALQLALNSVWSIVFFRLENIGWALVNVIALWLAIVWTMVLFSKISKQAAWLLVPYLLWVSFASYLTYSLWTLN